MDSGFFVKEFLKYFSLRIEGSAVAVLGTCKESTIPSAPF